MEKDTIIGKLIENTPLALMILGGVLLVIGSIGEVPKLNVSVKDLGGRVSLIAIGVLVLLFGGILLWNDKAHDSKTREVKKDYGIKITSPKLNARVGESFDVEGVYKTRPPDGVAWVLEYRPETMEYWPKSPLLFRDKSNDWYVPVRIGGGDNQKIEILVAQVGKDGRALLEYSLRVGEFATDWVSIKSLTSDFALRDSVTVIREKR